MPLLKGKSKDAFKKNVETEMHAGKPQDQSLAISYSIQRQAKKKKKFAYGGKAENDANPGTPAPKPDNMRPSHDEIMSGQADLMGIASSGRIPTDMRASADSEQDGMSMAQRIRRKRQMFAEGGEVTRAPASSEDEATQAAMDEKAHHQALDFSDEEGMTMDANKKENYSEGGMADLNEESEEHPNDYYKQNRMAANQEEYDDSQISQQPMDSNEHGKAMEDMHDESMIAAIRRKMAARRGM